MAIPGRKVSNNDKAETGIGTLIVFVAVIIAAMIAAGALVNITNIMQEQAENTGNQAMIDVSAGLRVVGITGDTNIDANDSASPQASIQVIKINLRLVPGSPGINFAKVVVRILDGNKTAYLTYNSTGTDAGDANADSYIVTVVRDDDGSFTNYNVLTQGDLIQLIISTDADATALELEPSTTVRLEIIPEEGSPTLERFTTPSTYLERFVELV
jgi:flagellin FlaB